MKNLEDETRKTKQVSLPQWMKSRLVVSFIAYLGSFLLFPLSLYLPLEHSKSLLFTHLPYAASSLTKAQNKENLEILILLLYLIHFLKRLIEVLKVHIYDTGCNVIEFFGASIYYWGFTVWIGLSCNPTIGFSGPPNNAFVIVGVLVMLIGEVGNGISHVQLRFLKTRKANKDLVLPKGFLFDYVDCPHYFFEMMSWAGFFLVSWTLAGLCFFLVTVIVLFMRSNEKRVYYMKRYDGKEGKKFYNPTGRKRLIPFVW